MTKKITELNTKTKSTSEPIDYSVEIEKHLEIQRRLSVISKIIDRALERKKNEDQRNNS